MSKFSLEESVSRACDALNFHPSIKEGLAAELARLRAVDEAWRAVQAAHIASPGKPFNVSVAVQRQIARLDQLAKEKPNVS